MEIGHAERWEIQRSEPSTGTHTAAWGAAPTGLRVGFGAGLGSMICQSADCEAEALVTALWPGQELMVCHSCANRAYGIAKVMGFTLYFGPLVIAAEPLAKEVEEWLVGKEDPTHYDPNEVGAEFRRQR